MATHCTRKRLDCLGLGDSNRSIKQQRPTKPNDLECTTSFLPPILGTSTDFCKEALAKGVPIEGCTLERPQKLVLNAGPSHDEMPTFLKIQNKRLKNWQKWCRVWKQNQEYLSLQRHTNMPPPIMTSGEGHSYKVEDKELFDRTTYKDYITGFDIRNWYRPDGTHPGQCFFDIHETILPKHFRVYPELKRYRYAQRIRDEIGLGDRCNYVKYLPDGIKFLPFEESVQNMEIQTFVMDKTSLPNENSDNCFNREHNWRDGEQVGFTRWLNTLDPEARKFGYMAPIPRDLIVKPDLKSNFDIKTDSTMHLPMTIPELTFGDESTLVEPIRLSQTSANQQHEKDYYSECRGPVLRIRGQRAQFVLNYKPPTDSMSSDLSQVEEEFFCEELDPFSSTTKGKETRYVTLKNEGTTAIRYQWLRFPFNNEMRDMLGNPARALGLQESKKPMNKVFDHIELDTGNHEFQKNNLQTKTILEQVYKPPSFEFFFRELPGVLLPGQSLDFPIMFRAWKPGYYYETLYLLTHPKISNDEGRSYAVRLTGLCMDPDLTETEPTPYRPANVEEAIRRVGLEKGAKEIIRSILDHAIFKKLTHQCVPKKRPSGKQPSLQDTDIVEVPEEQLP